MTKYHVNPATNRPGICRATKKGCPLQAQGAKHFDSKEEAKSYAEKSMSENSSTLKSSSKKSPVYPKSSLTIRRELQTAAEDAKESGALAKDVTYITTVDNADNVKISGIVNTENILDYKDVETEFRRGTIHGTNTLRFRLTNNNSFQENERALQDLCKKYSSTGSASMKIPTPAIEAKAAESAMSRKMFSLKKDRLLDLSSGEVTEKTLNKALSRDKSLKKDFLKYAIASNELNTNNEVSGEIYNANRDLEDKEAGLTEPYALSADEFDGYVNRRGEDLLKFKDEKQKENIEEANRLKDLTSSGKNVKVKDFFPEDNYDIRSLISNLNNKLIR